MTMWGYADRIPTSTSTLASSSTRHDTATISTSYALSHTLTITTASDEYAVLTQVSMDVNANTILGVTLTGGYSTEIEGASESAIEDIQTGTAEGGASSDCTNDTNYTTRTEAISPNIIGPVGKDITVRYYIKTSSVTNTSDICTKNEIMTGKLVKRVSRTFGGQWKNWF